MLGYLLAIGLGLGIYLIYEGLTNPQSPRPPRFERTRDFLVRAGLREVGPVQFTAFSLASGLVIGGLAYLLLHWPASAALIGVAGLFAPLAYYSRRHNRRQFELQRCLPDAIGQLRDQVRTGLALQEALSGLATHGPEALRPEFETLVRDIGRLRGLEPALTAMGDRLADPVVDMLVTSLRLHENVGGSLSQILDRLAQAARGEYQTQQTIRAQQARNVTVARIIAGISILLLVGLRQVNTDYMAVYNGPGQALLIGELLFIALGYGVMLWIARPPAETRVMR